MLKSTYRPAAAPPNLPPGWTEHKAPTGHSYYYNAATQQSTYTRPAESQQEPLPSHATSSNFAVTGWPGQPAYHNGDNPSVPELRNAASNRGNFYQGRGASRGDGYRWRPQPKDRPKSKQAIPGCEPWLLIKTKLERRFVHNPERNESFWKFPPDVMKGVVELDQVEREAREKQLGQAPEQVQRQENPTVSSVNPQTTSLSKLAIAPTDGGVSDEYEEVEVTDDEGDEENGSPSKRQKTEKEVEEQVVEFNEDDIAYQLAAMGQDYGLDPGEYGNGEGEDWEEGAEGLALTEEDSSALFKDMLDDHHVNPYTPWEKVIEAGQIIEDDRYTVLSTMKSRKDVWDKWSREKICSLKEQREKEEKKDPRITYLAFLQNKATPKLYWPEFWRKHLRDPEMRNSKLSDKEKEKWYREYINRLKLSESTLKSDLVSMLKATSLKDLNRSTLMDALPAKILTDLRYISVRRSVRDPMIEAYLSSLPEAPEDIDISSEDAESASKQKQDKERRRALAERQMRVQQEKHRARQALEYSKGALREGEQEIDRAMKVGRSSLLGYMEEEKQAPFPREEPEP